MPSGKGNVIYSLKLINRFARRYLIISLFLSIFEMVLPIVNVYGLKVVIDSVESGKSFAETLRFLMILFAILLSSYVVSSLYKKRYRPIEVKKIRGRLREYFYSIASSVDLEYYDNTDFYNKYVKALSEMEGRIFGLISIMCNIVGSVSCLVTVVALAISMDWFVLLISFISIVFSVGFSILGQNVKFAEDNESILPERRMQYVDRVYFLSQFAKEIRIFTLGGYLKRILNDSNSQSIEVTKKYSGKQTAITLMSSAVSVLYIIGIMVYLSYRASRGYISVGDFAALLTASQSFNAQFESLFDCIPKIHENAMYMGYIREFSDSRSAIEDKLQGESMSYGRSPKIEIENVSFSYPGTDKKVIDNISLTVNEGEAVAVVGENGVGKSTLLKLLLRLYDVDEGVIRYNGTPVSDYNIKSLRGNIGVVFQDLQHYSMSVRENLCLCKENISDDEIYSALRQVGMEEKIKSFPKGLDTVIGREFDPEGVEFSGGEYQKLSLARAIRDNQGLVILDEPSSALDPISEAKFRDNLRVLCKDRTAVIVSHRLALTRSADKIVVVDGGRIVESGSHDQLMQLKGKYAEMFENQAKDYQ